MPKVKMDPKIEKQLRQKHYGVFGHSAVQICLWTKKSLHNEGFCYKQKFYGIDTHRCMEFSPAAVFCEMNCIFCWRPMEFMKNFELKKSEADEPERIYEELLKERKKLLSGFPGDGKTDMDKFRESLKPDHFAISLSGEPTLYPKLPEMVKFLKSLPETKSIFIVSNGQEPKMLERLERENALPTQLYISVNAPNEELFKNICCPVHKDAWERFLETLEIFSGLNTRRVLRITVIRGINMYEKYLKEYADLVRKAKPHFVEVKAYMAVGYSRERLGLDNMPYHREVRNFAEKLAREIGFDVIDEKEDSRVVLLGNKKQGKPLKIKLQI